MDRSSKPLNTDPVTGPPTVPAKPRFVNLAFVPDTDSSTSRAKAMPKAKKAAPKPARRKGK